MKDNIPDNMFVGNNIFLRPEGAILKIWWKLVFNQFKFNIRPSLHWYDTKQNEEHQCTYNVLH